MVSPTELRTRIVKLSRDWRVRVLVPVLLINLAAFVGLYTLMYRYAMTNLVNTHKFGAMLLLDELELDLHDLSFAHDRSELQKRLSQHKSGRQLLAVSVYDPAGQPIASTRASLSNQERAQAQVVLTNPDHPAVWLTEAANDSSLFGVRAVRNNEQCAVCHSNSASLGAIQIGIDMSGALSDATARVRRNFVMAGGAWLSLLALMFWTGGVVIGRPLALMEKSISATGLNQSRRHDLEALASNVHETLWGLIRKQREREADITRNMARAEQLAALGELAAGLTHEIKNPLAGVAAAVELLRDETSHEDRPYGREIYDQILAEVRRVTTTVEGLLRLAKPQPPQVSPVDLARVSREVASLFRARVRRQGITLETEIAESVPPLALDASLMVQLLMNLLTNAMQATERGGTIKVITAPFPRNDGVVMIVSDTGRGIDREHLEKIFDPFFTTKEEGTGLGLPICRQIAEQHGGTLEIESEPGHGTRVMVLLPDAQAARERLSDGLTAAG